MGHWGRIGRGRGGAELGVAGREGQDIKMIDLMVV